MCHLRQPSAGQSQGGHNWEHLRASCQSLPLTVYVGVCECGSGGNCRRGVLLGLSSACLRSRGAQGEVSAGDQAPLASANPGRRGLVWFLRGWKSIQTTLRTDRPTDRPTDRIRENDMTVRGEGGFPTAVTPGQFSTMARTPGLASLSSTQKIMRRSWRLSWTRTTSSQPCPGARVGAVRAGPQLRVGAEGAVRTG